LYIPSLNKITNIGGLILATLPIGAYEISLYGKFILEGVVQEKLEDNIYREDHYGKNNTVTTDMTAQEIQNSKDASKLKKAIPSEKPVISHHNNNKHDLTNNHNPNDNKHPDHSQHHENDKKKKKKKKKNKNKNKKDKGKRNSELESESESESESKSESESESESQPQHQSQSPSVSNGPKIENDNDDNIIDEINFTQIKETIKFSNNTRVGSESEEESSGDPNKKKKKKNKNKGQKHKQIKKPVKTIKPAFNDIQYMNKVDAGNKYATSYDDFFSKLNGSSKTNIASLEKVKLNLILYDKLAETIKNSNKINNNSEFLREKGEITIFQLPITSLIYTLSYKGIFYFKGNNELNEIPTIKKTLKLTTEKNVLIHLNVILTMDKPYNYEFRLYINGKDDCDSFMSSKGERIINLSSTSIEKLPPGEYNFELLYLTNHDGYANMTQNDWDVISMNILLLEVE
jgi:hypothetical protein